MSVELYSFKPYVLTNVHYSIPTPPNRCPQPRSGHRIVCDEGNLYSFGGYNPNASTDEEEESDEETPIGGTLFKELWKFNLATKTWKKMSHQNTIPGDELASNAMVLANNAILMIYGGTGIPFGINVSNNLYMYNIHKGGKMCLVHVTGKTPAKMYGQAILLVGKFLYTIGGTTGYEFSADVHRLDLASNEWEEVYICKGINGTEPHGRYRHEMAYDGTRIFILGGGTSSEVYGFEEIPAFNIHSGIWEKLLSHADPLAPSPGIPPARRCHGCVSLRGNNSNTSAVFISGGYNGSDVYDDVWRLELQTLQWTLLAQCKFPRPVYFHSAAITSSGHMYTFGGIEKHSSETERCADVHAAWVTIPALSEICWEAFVHYTSSRLETVDKSHLLELGVPLSFVQRVYSVKI